MASSTILIDASGTYDLDTTYNGYEVYVVDCTYGNITLDMAQANATGLYYQIIRVDNSVNTLTINAYSGDTMNGTYTTYSMPINTNVWCQTVATGNWILPVETVNFAL